MTPDRSGEADRHPRQAWSTRTRLLFCFSILVVLALIAFRLGILDSSAVAFVGLLIAIGFTMVVLSLGRIGQELRTRTAELTAANTALRAAFADARSMIESSLDPLVTVAEDGKITDVNKAMEEMTGVTRDAMIGRDLCDHFTEPERVRLSYELVFSEGAVRDYQLRMIHTSGRVTDVLYNASLFRDERGRAMGVFAAARDITAIQETIMRLNQELQRRGVALEAINKELEAFSHSVSHDLRAPLRSIDGFSLAALEDCGEAVGEQGREHLERIRAAVQQMEQLIDDLLKLSGVTRQKMRCEPVDLTALAQSVADDLQDAEPTRGVEFEIEDGLTVNGDENLLGVAIRNLLGNAWKFSGKHARSRIEFGLTKCNDEIAYFVRDDGVGFDMAYADKLFGAFRRLHAQEEFPGTGIGLATVQRIISRHGGRVWAEGKVDHGATFYFTLGECV